MFGTKKKVVTLHVSGMKCEHCAARVKAAIEKTKGASASIDLAAATAVIECPEKTDPAALAAAVTEAGYPTEVKS